MNGSEQRKHVSKFSKARICSAVISILLFAASSASAIPLIGGTDFVFVSDGGAMETQGDPANTADGANANGTFADQTIGVQYRGPTLVLPVTFEYSFTQVVDVFGDFTLYNGWDIQNQGIGDFTLTFFDALDAQIGSPFSSAAADAPPSTEIFNLVTTYLGVSSVELMVTSVHSGEIEFREIAFEGSIVSVSLPVPMPLPTLNDYSLILLGLLVLGFGAVRFRRIH